MVCSLVAFPLCMLPALLLRRRVKDRASRTGTRCEYLGDHASSIAGIRVAKSHAREGYEVERFTKTAKDVNSNAIACIPDDGNGWAACGNDGVFGDRRRSRVLLGEGVSFDVFSFRVLLLVALYPDVKALSRMQTLMHRCTMASDSVFKLLDERPEVEDAPNALKLERARGELSFENVVIRTGRQPQR